MANSFYRTYKIEGIDCAACASQVESTLQKLDSVHTVSLDFMAKRLHVTISTDEASVLSAWNQIEKKVMSVEPDVKLTTETNTPGYRMKRPSLDVFTIIRFGIALVFLGISFFVESSFQFFILIGSYVVSGYDVVLKSLRNIARGNIFDEYFLMTLATIAAFVIGEPHEAVAVMLFYQVGEFFQNYAINRSRISISDLMDMRNEITHVLENGRLTDVPSEQVPIGTTFIVKAGQRIPLDAVVTKGTSLIDMKALTGESIPVRVNTGDTLLSGSINSEAPLEAISTASYEDSTAGRIIDLMEHATKQKARPERFVTTFARYYTPIVVIGAVLMALIGSIVTSDTEQWVYRSLVFLVISCPCALVVSIPMGFFGGIGAAARLHVMIKGSVHLSSLAKASTVVFDKTGTITTGEFSLQDIFTVPNSKYPTQRLLQLAASVELHSHHPLAKALVEASREPLLQASEITEYSGQGIAALVDGMHIVLGNRNMLETYGIDIDEQMVPEGLYMAIDNRVEASLRIGDKLKERVSETIEDLQRLGISRIAIISGDRNEHVRSIAEQSSIEEYYGQLLPDQKVIKVQQLRSDVTKGTVVYVGDGMNDAPVLAVSDVGIAMGAIGSEAAIEASDIVVMNDDVSKVVDAIEVSRLTSRIVLQNIIGALSIKFVVMALGLFGITSLWAAVFADTGVALLAVLNSLRPLLAVKRMDARHM